MHPRRGPHAGVGEGAASACARAQSKHQENGPVFSLPNSSTSPFSLSSVIKLVLQFCREHGLASTFVTLSSEAGVSLNAVDSVEALAADVKAGRWETVLPALAAWRLSPATAAALHEQVALELVELREGEAAAAVVAGSAALRGLAASDPPRLARLERLAAAASGGGATVAAVSLDPASIFGEGTPRAARRAAVAAALVSEAVSPPPGRLLTLVGQALQAQFGGGGSGGGGGGAAAAGGPPASGFDLLTGAAAPLPPSEEAPPGLQALAIRFGLGAHPEAAAWAPGGPAAGAAVLATGSVDGLVELWDGATGGPGRASGVPSAPPPADMAHASPVLALAWSADGALLASGDRDGSVRVWNPVSGRCLRRLEGAHAGGVAALAFAPGASHLVSGGYDGAARVHGLQSGRVLRELRGHAAAVLALACLPGGGLAGGDVILSGGADGCVRGWDAKTGEAGATFRPPPPPVVAGGGGGGQAGAAAAPAASPDQPIVALLPLPLSTPGLPGPAALVLPRGPAVHVMTPAGTLVRSLASGRPAGAGSDFVSAALSPSGALAHCLAEDGVVFTFDVGTGALVSQLAGAVEGTAVEVARQAAAAAGGAAALAAGKGGPSTKAAIPIGLAHHPARNLLATWATDGVLKVWVPGTAAA